MPTKEQVDQFLNHHGASTPTREETQPETPPEPPKAPAVGEIPAEKPAEDAAETPKEPEKPAESGKITELDGKPVEERWQHLTEKQIRERRDKSELDKRVVELGKVLKKEENENRLSELEKQAEKAVKNKTTSPIPGDFAKSVSDLDTAFGAEGKLSDVFTNFANQMQEGFQKQLADQASQFQQTIASIQQTTQALAPVAMERAAETKIAQEATDICNLPAFADMIPAELAEEYKKGIVQERTRGVPISAFDDPDFNIRLWDEAIARVRTPKGAPAPTAKQTSTPPLPAAAQTPAASVPKANSAGVVDEIALSNWKRIHGMR